MADRWDERLSRTDQIWFRGERLFQIMDSQGIPLDTLLELLREKDAFFDVMGFVRAAHDSKNFRDPERLFRRLTADPTMPDAVKEKVRAIVHEVYKDDPPLTKQKLKSSV